MTMGHERGKDWEHSLGKYMIPGGFMLFCFSLGYLIFTLRSEARLSSMIGEFLSVMLAAMVLALLALRIRSMDREAALEAELGECRELAENLRREQDFILEQAPMAISRVCERKQVWFNSKIQEMFGYSREEMLHQSTRMLYPSQEAFERLALDAAPVLAEGRVFRTVQSLVRKDGTVIEVRYIGQAIDPADPAKGTIWIAEDFTEQKLMEEELRRERDLLQLITATSPIGIMFVDRTGRIEYANTHAQQILGYTTADLSRLSYNAPEFHIMSHDHQPVPDGRLPFAMVMTSGQPVYDVELVIERPDGSRALISVNGAPLRDQEGNVSGMVAAIEDISERKRAEKALEASEEMFSRIVNTADEGIWMADREYVITYANKRMAEILGLRVQDMLGRNFEEFVPENELADHRERVRLRMKGISEHYERRMIRRDGSLVSIEMRATPLLDNLDRFQGAFSMCTDITGRKKMEKELRDSNLLLQRTLASLNEAVFIVQTGTRIILEVNPVVERMFGYSRAEILGARTSCLHVSEEMAQRFGTEMLEAYEQKGYYETVYLMRRKDGSFFDSEHFVTPIREDNGMVKSHVCVVRDISGRVRAEEALALKQHQLEQLNQNLELRVTERTMELEQINRELEGFCYSISHELTAPIARLEGFSRMLEEAATEENISLTQLLSERMGVSCRRLRTVIDALLMLNRIPRASMLFEEVNLSELAGQIVVELLEEGGGRGSAIAIAPGLGARGDRKMLAVCLRNLLGNALKYSAGNGEASVEFGAYAEDDGRVFFVRDNGAGFDMSFYDKLFEPFCRLHNEGEFQGDGIGLAIVLRIIERHGGRIWAESVPGAGATFYFSLGT